MEEKAKIDGSVFFNFKAGMFAIAVPESKAPIVVLSVKDEHRAQILHLFKEGSTNEKGKQ